MDTLTLCQCACSDPRIKKTFGGVYPSDFLPLRKRHYSSFVVNLDPHTLSGSHWVSIHFKDDDSAYYFDSYGRAPSNKNILNFLTCNANRIFYNKVCFQDYATTSCGKFCLYFLFCLARGFSLKDLDTSDKGKNELFIRQFFIKNFKRRKRCCHPFHAKKQKCAAWINMSAIRTTHH
jgi:hypothetical protein